MGFFHWVRGRALHKLAKLSGVLRHPAYWSALLKGVAASIEHQHVLANFQCNTIVDIGGNRGQFALVARFYNPEARIISFEPLPEASQKYRNVFSADKRVQLHQVAIGPSSTEAQLQVAKDDDSSSLLPITSLQERLFPGTSLKGTIVISVEPLSSFIRAEDVLAPALLKVDVQGYELEALKGCEDLLDRFDFVLIECSFLELYAGQALAHEIIRYLDARGLVLRNVYNIAFDDGKAIQGEFAFTRGTRRDL